ncbi:hypothetical protein [Ensifer aridi]|uniref:hypothetical protein n=1 Tax=Ensifer aridi TaxID=1708715 RepID=UPI00358F4472
MADDETRVELNLSRGQQMAIEPPAEDQPQGSQPDWGVPELAIVPGNVAESRDRRHKAVSKACLLICTEK